MTSGEISDWFSQHPEIETVFAAICDLNGTLRGKRIPVSQAAKLGGGGLRMPLSAANVDIWGEDIEDSELVFQSGDADGICEPTGRLPVCIDWTNQPAALVPLWLSNEDGSPFLGDPRRALASVVDRYHAIGLTPVVATELEFYLFDPSKDRPRPPRSPVTGNRAQTDCVLSMDELEEYDGILNDIYASCTKQGIPADAAISENGAGQFEINPTHTHDPLKAADDAVLFKRLVRGIARKHGMAATFMAKPYGNRSGNGFHVHFSLLDQNGNNVFDDGGDKGSPVLLNAVAGLLDTMQDNALVFAPHANSYRRLLPGTHAPTGVAWGYENRTAAIRIPGGNHKARRIEHRVAGADANPYLVLSSILGGALLGIEGKRVPTDPISGDAYSLDLPQFPSTWNSAVERFENGPEIGNIYSQQLRQMFVACKRQEMKRIARHVTDIEYQSYLEVV